MSTINYRLGIVADLSPNGSIHQQTFIRAVEMAARQLDFEQRGIELIWENDYATFEGGHQSAQILVQKKVDAVIGHYASAAAKGALPYYEKKEIPLLMPAATADFLAADFRSAFRLCGRDGDLVDLICQTFLENQIKNLYIGNDNSIHGKALSNSIIEKLRRYSGLRIAVDWDATDHLVYVGSYSNSVKFVKGLPTGNGRPKTIYFADDLVHPSLATDLDGVPHKVFVFGYESANECLTAKACVRDYRKEWKADPNTYYLETYAAMQVAQQLFDSNLEYPFIDRLHRQHYQTVLGNFQFSNIGESGFKRFCLWTLQNGILRTAPKNIRTRVGDSTRLTT